MIKIKHLSCALIAAASLVRSAYADSMVVTSNVVAITSQAWQKPAWLTDLSLSIHESYDDNILLVSGNGMQPQYSWITAISPKVGFNFAPLLGGQSPVKTLTLLYAPDFNIYHDAPQESYDAQKVAD